MWHRVPWPTWWRRQCAATAPVIFLAAFDNVNALTPKKRTVKAAYAEVLVPLGDLLETRRLVALLPMIMRNGAPATMLKET